VETIDTLKSRAARFCRDQRGSMATMWAVSLLTIMFAVGSSFDASQASKARKLAQIAADSMALTASIAVDMNNDERFVEGVQYSYSEIGGPSKDFTGTMLGSVEYDVQDGDDKLIARATVSGSYKTAFMSMIGVEAIPVSAASDVAYADQAGTPASVFFVVDNSGSMADLDSTGTAKITNLEDSLTVFMDKLRSLDDDGNDDTYRTALYPFSADPDQLYSDIDDDGVIPSHVTPAEWGAMTDNDITRMYDRYGTDSNGALQQAADVFAFENDVHAAVHGEADPLKFLVFMTDGANNQSYECATEQVWVENITAEYWWRITGNQTRYAYEEPNNTRHWTYVPEQSDGTGYYDDQEVCEWDYYFDVRSLQACDQMKADNVQIYAIAYDVDADQKAHAEEFLQNCSSGPEFFKTADDASALEAAFEEIGDAIVTEVIRIKR
jgi:hypothetical protein